jgi:hypothetical protein
MRTLLILAFIARACGTDDPFQLITRFDYYMQYVPLICRRCLGLRLNM